jgi:hypothetical protein
LRDSIELDDTWEWDGIGWARRLTPRTPGPHVDHSLAYDSVRHVLVLFGGEAGFLWPSVTWELGATSCLCDWNSSGTVDSTDFFDFISLFFLGGDCDFNLDGRCDSQDFFEFLGCFFAGCP